MKDVLDLSYFDSYRTTFNRQFLVNEIAKKINDRFIHNDRFPKVTVNTGALKLLNGIKLITATDTNVPILSHPFIADTTPNQNTYVYIDVRAVSRINPHEQTLVITNESAFNIIRWRANLVRYSLIKGKASLWDSCNFTSAIYASWLSESLSKRFSLDLSVSTKILVIAAVFYNVLFNGISLLANETSCSKLAIATTKRLGRYIQDTSLVETIITELYNLEGLGAFNTLADLVYAIKNVTGNIRLSNLSEKQVAEATGYGWYGSDSASLCATALEDPSTFITLCVIGHENQNYHKTIIGSIVKRRSSEMSRSIDGLVNEITTIPF